MSAPVYSMPANPQQEIVDFLRRLSSMLTGGRNAEMLQQAAATIETLGRRASSAEQLFQDQQEDHARNLELREVAELASDNLMSEVESLKAEIDLLKAQVDERQQQLEDRQSRHETDRNHFAEEALRLQAMTEISEARLAHAEIEELRKPPPEPAFDDSIAVVPVQSLQLARTQFDYLAKGFADKGDIVSLTICEIGARTIDKALAGSGPVSDAGAT
jgi:hypothetical protein